MRLGRRSWSARLAAVQGASYIAFSLWSLLGRGHYRRTHNIEKTDAWVLNAHGMWLLLTGLALTVGAARERLDATELRALALGAAIGMAVNDAVAAPAPIYRSDLFFETGIAAAWPLAWAADAAARR